MLPVAMIVKNQENKSLNIDWYFKIHILNTGRRTGKKINWWVLIDHVPRAVKIHYGEFLN